jgi:hypothetical protein
MLVRSALASGALAGSALLPGCLTQNVQFDVPRNYPPSIESEPGARYPLNQVITPTGRPSGGDGGSEAMEIELDLLVRDPNVEQRLDFRVFIDFQAGSIPTIVRQGVIPPASGGDRIERRQRIPIPIAAIGQVGRCHRIEVLVSSSFQEPGPAARLPVPDPGRTADLASATWWVALPDPDAPSGAIDMSACPR